MDAEANGTNAGKANEQELSLETPQDQLEALKDIDKKIKKFIKEVSVYCEEKHREGVFASYKTDPINMVQKALMEQTDKLESLSMPMRRILIRGAITDHKEAEQVLQSLIEQQQTCFLEYDQLKAMLVVLKRSEQRK